MIKNRDLILNLVVWPTIAALIVIAARLAGQITWTELLKILPIMGILVILYTAALLNAFRSVNRNNTLIEEHRRDIHILRGVMEGQPIPSARTGHEHLGDPSVSGYIMGAIPKKDAKSRIARFYQNMDRGVSYRFLYLDEPGTRAGLLAYCRELSSVVERKRNTKRGLRFQVQDRFQAKIVPVASIQLSFDIFDHETERARMLIHFPRFGPLSADRFNMAWMLYSGDAIRHYTGVFQHIWTKAGPALNVLTSGERGELVFDE